MNIVHISNTCSLYFYLTSYMIFRTNKTPLKQQSEGPGIPKPSDFISKSSMFIYTTPRKSGKHDSRNLRHPYRMRSRLPDGRFYPLPHYACKPECEV
ncbi:hypothetical protein PJIAN_244 [Paludibacter jiangxiensis]|uniref:Uncharacterized protein n=1 Tax=Paludibacter jiangxiensis TaxID=681398 RepID=A0A161LDT2_9BACT|nr:hypothetical protein PJIAN_244 [Paludibacter jiangxiensis]